MKQNYRKLGDLVDLIDERNSGEKVKTLIGVSIDKCFIKSVANTIGTDLSKYQIIRKNDFACSLMQVSRDGKIPIACLKEYDEAIMSPAYYIFRIKDTNKVLPDYLTMWFMRTEFDREASYIAVGGVRGSMPWEDFCNMELPVPDLTEQQRIVNAYNTVDRRIRLLQQINEKLEATAQCLFDEMFKNNCELLKNGNIVKNWCYKTLDSIADFTYGKMADDNIKTKDGKFPIFSGYHNVGFSNEYMFDESQIVVLARGVSGTGEVRLSPKFCWLTNLSIAVLLKDRNFFFFYFYYLRNDNLRSLDSGSAQSQITINNLASHKVVIPPKELVIKFGNEVSVINNTVLSNKNEIEKLQNLKQLIISRISGM